MTAAGEKRDIRGVAASARELMLAFPLYIVSRPFKAFDEMKNLKRGDMRFVVVMFILAGLVAILREAYTGFVITEIWTETPFVDVRMVLVFTYSPIALFCIANWSVTTITDGKGSIRDIVFSYAYALYPMLFCTLIGIALSNVVTLNEAAFANFFFVFGVILQFFYLFIGLTVVHEYGFFRSVFMVFLTLVAMLVIIFILVLLFSLINNIVGIVWSVIIEINLHHMN